MNAIQELTINHGLQNKKTKTKRLVFTQTYLPLASEMITTAEKSCVKPSKIVKLNKLLVLTRRSLPFKGVPCKMQIRKPSAHAREGCLNVLIHCGSVQRTVYC